MNRIVSLSLAAALLSACVSTQTKEVLTDKRFSGPKIVAMSGARASWVYEIEKRLRKNGFKIKRMASQNLAVEKVSETKTKAYNEATARFILHIDGYAPNTSMRRCLGGGYKFQYINVELIDVTLNETVLHYSNSGYTENCPPFSGTIFTDITNMISQSWE